MFDHFLVSVLVAPVVILLATWLLADRLRPDVSARVFAWSALAAALASAVNLLAFALKAVAELPVVARAGEWSAEVVVRDTAHVPWVSWLSLAWTVFIGFAVTRRVRRYTRAMRGAHRSAESLGSTDDVVVVPDERVDAFALPGAPGRVVVTSAMRALLTDAQYAAVVAHERAHLAHNHQRLVWVAALAAVLHPVLVPVARKVEYLVERAADEEAAQVLGDRSKVARAIGVAALAATARPVAARGVGPLPALGTAPGVVPGRVKALLGPGRVSRWQLVVPVALAAGTVVWTGECVYDLVELLALASR